MYWDLFNVAETVIVVWMFGLDGCNSGEGICYYIFFSSKIFDMHIILGQS